MVNAEQIKKKYDEERDKRRRSDGTSQYVPIELGSKAELDPFAREIAPRDVVDKETEVAVIGAGWAGELTAVNLRKEGLDDFIIIDKAADFGGVWYWNRYPGIACDCESYLYMPMLEETGYVPSRRYAPGDEVRAYAQHLAERYNLHENALFQTYVTDVTWNAETSRWIIATNRGDTVRARFVVIGSGGLLHRPKLPGVKGLDTFEGPWFHTSRWDYDITGGNERGGLDKLKGKKVAIVGSGLTALQAFPKLVESGAEVYLVQRTPQTVATRDNADTDSEWFTNQPAGWQRVRQVNFEEQLLGRTVDEKIVSDSWTDVWYIPPFEGAADMDEFLQQVDDNDLAIMEGLRSRVDEVVKDRETAEALKPWYTTHCKRPGFSDEFLQAFNEPNAHMVDTKGKGMDEVTPKGFVVDGKEYEVDLIIYATGFETIVSPTRAGGFEVNGPGGYTLTEAWSEGFRSLHGLQMHGLPNLYLVGGLRHTGLSANVTFALSECGAHIAKSVKQFLEDGVIEVDVTDEAVQRWTDIIAEKRDMVYNAEQVANCTPGYYNNEGSSDASGAIDKNAPIYAYAYGGGPMEYFEILADWRDSRQYVNDAKVTAGTRG